MSQENPPTGNSSGGNPSGGNRPADGAPVLQRYDPCQTAALSPLAAIGAGKANPPTAPATPALADQPARQPVQQPARPVEIGGPSGPEPTRYGDWERNGRVSDF